MNENIILKRYRELQNKCKDTHLQLDISKSGLFEVCFGGEMTPIAVLHSLDEVQGFVSGWQARMSSRKGKIDETK